jgi:hypothetical protein
MAYTSFYCGYSITRNTTRRLDITPIERILSIFSRVRQRKYMYGTIYTYIRKTEILTDCAAFIYAYTRRSCVSILRGY